jgi:hypothetical protein
MVKLSRSQYLLINSAVAEPEAASGFFSQWLNENDLDDIRGPDLRMLPLIFANLGERLKDSPAHTRLKGVSRHILLANRLRMEQCGKFIDLLQQKDIPVLLLKGSAMIVAIANDVGHRMMADCDILVPRARAAEAIEQLHNSGLQSLPMDAAKFNEGQFGQHHGISFRTGSRSDDVVDIHWRPLREIESDAFTAELFDHAREVTFARRTVGVPSFEHMLIQATLHSYSARAEGRYDWIADIALIMRNRKLNWPMIEASAKRHEFRAMLGDALHDMRDVVSIAAPSGVVERLEARASRIEQHELRMFKSGSMSLVRGNILLTLQRLRRRHLGKKIFGRSAAKLIGSVLSPKPTHTVVSAEGNYDADFIHGWSFFETTGRWSIGQWAWLTLTVDDKASSSFLRILAASVEPRPTVKIFFNWKNAVHFKWSDDCCHIFKLPNSLHNRKILSLLFRISNPIAPNALGLSPDVRELGLRILDLRTSAPVRDIRTSSFRFDLNGGDFGMLWGGWSMPDETGCWSAGRKSELRWRAAHSLPAGTRITAHVAKYKTHQSSPATLRVSFNGRAAGFLTLDSGNAGAPQDFTIVLPVSVAADEEVAISFSFDECGPDQKPTGRIFLTSIAVSDEARA